MPASFSKKEARSRRTAARLAVRAAGEPNYGVGVYAEAETRSASMAPKDQAGDRCDVLGRSRHQSDVDDVTAATRPGC